VISVIGGHLSDYLTWEDLKTRWGKLDSQLLEYLEKGLQPYSRNRNPMPCPTKHHEYYYLHSKRFSNTQSISKIRRSDYDDSEDDILPSTPANSFKKTQEERIEELEKAIIECQNNMNIIEEEDPDCVSWKYFMNPRADGEIDKIISDLREAVFEKKAVIEFEKKHDLIKKIKTKDAIFKKAAPELERLYSVLLYKFGSSSENDPEEIQQIILDEFERNRNIFSIIKEDYLTDITLYYFSSRKMKRDFIGKLLLKISKDHRLGLNDYQKIYKMFREWQNKSTNFD